LDALKRLASRSCATNIGARGHRLRLVADLLAAQAAFWEAIAARCADSPAIFCYS